MRLQGVSSNKTTIQDTKFSEKYFKMVWRRQSWKFGVTMQTVALEKKISAQINILTFTLKYFNIHRLIFFICLFIF